MKITGSSPPPEQRPGAGAPWSYEGETGPANWGRFYPACNGSRQSPVDLAGAIVSPELSPLRFLYQSRTLRVVNDGHTARIEFQPGSVLEASDETYDLVQLHFHTPSEHTVEGSCFPMEAHLVHTCRETGDVALVGLFLRAGAPNPALEQVWDHIPSGAGQAAALGSIDAVALFGLPAPVAERFYTYEGSLTTPPCTEGVLWTVLKDPVEISAGQLARYQRLFRPNARPVQPLNGRSIRISTPHRQACTSR